MTADDVRAVFRRHAAAIRAGDERARARLLAVYIRASEELQAKLAALGGIDARFTPLLYATALGQAREAAAALYVDFQGALTDEQRRAMELAQQQVAERVAALSEHFEGTVRPFSVRPVETLLASSPWSGATVYDVLSTTADASSQALSGLLLERARTTLALSMAMREPLLGAGSAQARLVKALRVTEYRAEMTARTEHSRAYNLAHHTDLVEANAQGGDYEKSIVVVHDARTDPDSLFLERWLEAQGGSIPLDALFLDGDGRQYLTPPGRPNDRCCEIPWLRKWGGMDAVNSLTGGPRGLLFA